MIREWVSFSNFLENSLSNRGRYQTEKVPFCVIENILSLSEENASEQGISLSYPKRSYFLAEGFFLFVVSS
jgi:hypothetical protein